MKIAAINPRKKRFPDIDLKSLPLQHKVYAVPILLYERLFKAGYI
jgi:hypothetical protein